MNFRLSLLAFLLALVPSARGADVALEFRHVWNGKPLVLEEVVDHYADGIHRSPTLDPNLAKHAGRGVVLSREDRAALGTFTVPWHLDCSVSR